MILKLRTLWLSGLLLPACAWSQQVEDFLTDQTTAVGTGWIGFTDIGFLADALFTLVLAAFLGGLIAYHPKHVQTADTLEEIEAPKVYIMYAVIGSLIGMLVVNYGLVVGFVLFGIGGLIRFRTFLQSPRLTGQVIFVTLIGLSCGLDLPHVAVLATAFCFGLIYVFDARMTYRIDVRAVPAERVVEAATAYRSVLEQKGCRIVSEKKDPAKARVRFIFHCKHDVTREVLDDLFARTVDPALKGTIDWEID